MPQNGVSGPATEVGLERDHRHAICLDRKLNLCNIRNRRVVALEMQGDGVIRYNLAEREGP